MSDVDTRLGQERDRLLGALGAMTEGGIVEQIHHIGSTSVPGLPTSGCVDIGLAVWPFPLEAAAVTAVHALGYQAIPRNNHPTQLFRHKDGRSQLRVAMVGTDTALNPVILRDYLRHEAAAREVYSQLKADKTRLFTHLVAAARVWWVAHHGFGPVTAVAQELAGYPHPWYISSGWALDLFLGQPQRVHHDTDIVVRRSDQLVLQAHLTGRGWHLLTPLQGKLEPWPPHMFLHLPRHQVHAHRDGAFMDILISEIEHGLWRYRREPSVIQAVERIGLMTTDGLSYLAPELVLLFKSKNTGNQERPKDQQDFERVLPHLQPAQRAWLRWALLVTEPEHPWLDYL
ncbi:MAG: GrpB family protein [Ardenticatenaceae bacterium]|nr:GrpB family protein [Ardenticatenaceae bacterium]